MSNDPTPDEVRSSIVPSSDQINYDDLVSGPMTVTVEHVRRGSKEQPIYVELVGHKRSYRPCKSMRRVLIAAWGDDPKQWIGQRMTLYGEPSIVYAGVKVGGIRISHLSGIDKDREFVLTVGRGKKAIVKIKSLETVSPEDAAYIREAIDEIGKAESMETLKAIAFVLKTKSEAVRQAVRPAYTQRQKEIEG